MSRKSMAERLGQFQQLRREVDELSQRIAWLERKNEWFSGLPRSSEQRAIRAAAGLQDARERMEARRLECMEEIGHLYAFIDDIPDSRMRRIFSLRYIDGLHWQQVAKKIGEVEEQYPRKLHSRYLKKYEQDAK